MISEFKLMDKEGQTYAQIPCTWCKTVVDIPVTMIQIERWRNGAMIQQAMPQLSKDLREMFISGTCAKCWDQMFPPEDDDGEEA